ncbi:MAG: hypothetical protein H6Q93_246, partial [Nitrospirae bacterium]|nr:hypothetical protein [Nitrospirota bacterium]
SVEICRQSNLYDVFTREEKREAVMHVYSMINEAQHIDGKALTDPSKFQSVFI